MCRKRSRPCCHSECRHPLRTPLSPSADFTSPARMHSTTTPTTAPRVNTTSIRKLNAAIRAGIDAVATAREQSRPVSWSDEALVLRLHKALPSKITAKCPASELHTLPLHPSMPGPLQLTADGGWCCSVCHQSGNAAWPWKKSRLFEHLGSDAHLNVLRGQHLSGSLEATAKAAGTAKLDAGQIVEVAKDTNAILAAHGTMSFCNASRCLRAAQQVVTDITGDYRITVSDLRLAVGNPQLHSMLLRLQAVSCRDGEAPLLLHPTNISRRIIRLADMVLHKKMAYFQDCPQIWMIVDETTTRNGATKPAYVALCGVSPQFDYLMSFVGQANTSNASGADLLVLLWDIAEAGGATATNLSGVTTDGCHSMRSDRAHAGIIPWAGSKSFVARLKTKLSSNLLALACAAHNVNLAVGDAMNSSVPPFFMAFLRVLATEFSRSAKRKGELRSLYQEYEVVFAQLTELDDEVTKAPSLLFPKKYCHTRWSGVLICCKAIGRCMVPLMMMKEQLRAKGFGPKMNDSYGDQDEVASGQDDMLAWKAVKPNITGLAEDFPEGKRSNLLNYWSGVNPENWLLMSGVASVLEVYQVLITRLQITLQPIGHKLNRWVDEFTTNLDVQFIQQGSIWTGQYFYAREHFLQPGSAQENTMLVEHTDAMITAFATALRDNVISRLQPYRDFYVCLELIDPVAAAPPGNSSAWQLLHDLCDWWAVDEGGLRADIVTLKSVAQGLPLLDRQLCQENLLAFYKSHHDRGPLQSLSHLKRFARCVLSIPIASAFVESLFSVMASTKTQKRGSLSDDTVAACMHLRDVEDPAADCSVPTARAVDGKLDMQLRLLRHQEHRL